MSEIAEAIAAKQTRVAQLESEINDLRQATAILGGTTATISSSAAGQPTVKLGRPKMRTAAERKAHSERMKAVWAKKRRAQRVTAKIGEGGMGQVYRAREEQPTKLQSSWWKSSRVNCPCRTRSDATSRGRQPTGRCVV